MDNNIKHGSVIVIPHIDDEIYCTGSILVTYPYEITIITTHPTDTCKPAVFEKQCKMYEKCIDALNNYRTQKGYGKIKTKIIDGALPNGLPPELYIKAISEVENAIKEYDVVDYYAYTVRSGHQSHTECNQIAMAVMRHDYLAKMKKILMCPYPMTFFSPGYFDSEDKAYNAFITMSEDEAKLLYEIVDEIYLEKSPRGSVLGGEALFDAFRFFGRNIGVGYAQPFVCKRIIL